MELTEKQAAQLKATQLEMLKITIDICEKLNLRYYLMFGTLIGAIRHQGFIPWDDDIDIGMMREDYEIFLEKAPALLPEGFFLQTIWSDKEYLMCFAKIRNSNTTFIEKTVANQNINHGVFMDIFPLDYYPETLKEQKKLKKKLKLYNIRISAEFLLSDRSKKAKVLTAISKLIYPSVRKTVEKKEKLIRAYPQSNFLHYGEGNNYPAPVSWYGDGVDVTFEGLTVKAPSEYDQMLRLIYGDYMVPPPADQRTGHHYTATIDLEKPYTAYRGAEKAP